MSNGASISFRVQDSGVASYIENIRQQSSRMSGEMVRDAARQTASAREQIKLIEEKIRALERQTRLDSQGSEIALRRTAQNRIITSQARLAASEDENRRKYNSGEITADEYRSRKKRINQLKDRFSESAISGETEDKIAEIREQTRQSQLLLGYMRENINTVRSTSQQQVSAIRQGDESLVDAVDENQDPLERLTNQLASQQIRSERSASEPEEKKKDWKKDMMSFANALAVDRVGSMIASMPQARNELEYVKPIMSTMGMMMGGVFGNVIDAISGIKALGFGLGQTSFGQLGTQLGEKMGEFAGSSLERTFKSRDALSSSNYALKALSGRGVGEVNGFGENGLGGNGSISGLNQNLERFGISFEQASQLQYNIATRLGYSTNLGRNTENIVGLQQGLGVKDETSMALLELVRSNRGSDRDISKIVGGILQRGQGGLFEKGDRSFLNEFLNKNYTQLQRTLLQTQNQVSSGTTFDILNKFNNVGGQFSARDSRSGGLIGSLQSSLANPGSDSMKALSFYIMRQQNPNMSLADTGIEIQKGLGSKSYLQSMMKYITGMGGDDSYQTYNVASAFGMQNNLAAAKQLLERYKSGSLGSSFGQYQLQSSGEYSTSAINQLGENQTSIYSKSTAQIQNAFIESAVNGIGVVKDKMVGLFGDMMEGLKEYIKNEITTSINQGKSEVIKSNSSVPAVPSNDATYRQWQSGPKF